MRIYSFGLGLPFLLTGLLIDRLFDDLYQSRGTPTSLHIDARGVIRQVVIGPQGYNDIIANARLIGA